MNGERRERTLHTIETHRLISILRADMRGREMEIAGALAESGIRALELSMVSPNFDRALRRLAEAFGERMAIGAGTVLTVDDLQRAIDAGASFIVSPNTNPEVIEATCAAGLVSLPGAMTATEVISASAHGADFVKLFPAVSLGPAFVRALRGPLPHLKLVPTGGVQLQHLPDYWRAGAAAVAIGSELVKQATFESENLDTLRERAHAFVAAAERAPHD